MKTLYVTIDIRTRLCTNDPLLIYYEIVKDEEKFCRKLKINVSVNYRSLFSNH